VSSENWRTATWDVGFHHYQKYIRDTGGPEISVDHVCADGFRLGRWVNTQRVHRRSNRLKPERFAQLDKLGLQWDPRAELQRAMLQALREFYKSEGHADVPYAHTTPEGLTLGKWVSSQRTRLRKGTAPADVADAMAFFGIRIVSHVDKLFDQGISELATYVETTGSSYVPSGHIADSGFALGRWFHEQKRLSDEMPKARRAQFDALGVRLDHDVREERWQSAFEHLASWVQDEGPVNLSHNQVTDDGFRLGQWLSVQRNWLRSGRLKEHRRRQLDALVPGWESAKPKWTAAEGLAALREAATMAFPLGASDYFNMRYQGLVEGPSLGWILKEFSTWTAACDAADVESGPSSEGWTPYSDADLSQALDDFFLTHGLDATAEEYADWARHCEAPSLGVVVRRRGSWREVRHEHRNATSGTHRSDDASA
jgi:hypothetical protein